MIYTIGQLSKETQCKIPTIRYYEEIGLLDKAQRSAGNQRQYTSLQCQRLHFIRHSRALGFSLDEIKQLIHLQDCNRHDPHQAHQVAQHHLADVRNKIEQLKELEQELLAMIDNCKGTESEDCLVLKSLNDVPEKGV
jgi:DNA-binding transcriptional MerR regulator